MNSRRARPHRSSDEAAHSFSVARPARPDVSTDPHLISKDKRRDHSMPTTPRAGRTGASSESGATGDGGIKLERTSRTPSKRSGGAMLTVRGVGKRYGGVRALGDVSLQVEAGEVRGLVGENGAGKSTLIKIISGAEVPDGGSVSVDGALLHPGRPLDALAAGISTVYQDPQLFGELTLAENVFLGDETVKNGRIDWQSQRGRVRALLIDIGLNPDLADQRVADLTVAERQLVAVAKALARKPKVLILDEPSAILSGAEVASLFLAVRRLRDQGVAVIYISHRLDELKEITDRVTVMRDGSIVSTSPTQELSIRQVAELMVGKSLEQLPDRRGAAIGERVLDVQEISRKGRFEDVSFGVSSGEVVALYGLVGSGASDIARALFGVAPIDSGNIFVSGASVTVRSTSDALSIGVCMVPANRKEDGIFGANSIAFNISIGHLDRIRKLGWLVDRKRERDIASDAVRHYSIKTPHITNRISNLSGGNAQKVVWARQTMGDHKIVILEEPTQGVDIGAKGEIHRFLAQLAGDGRAVVLVSSDLAEVQHVADRILIVRSGSIVAEFAGDAPAAQILALAAGDIQVDAAADRKEA